MGGSLMRITRGTGSQGAIHIRGFVEFKIYMILLNILAPHAHLKLELSASNNKLANRVMISTFLLKISIS